MRGIIKRTVRWSSKDLERLPKIVLTVGTADFLARIWEHPDAEPPLLDLYDAMLNYTAFHYYSKTSGDLSKPTRDLSKVTVRASKKVSKIFSARKAMTQSMPSVVQKAVASASTPEVRQIRKKSKKSNLPSTEQ